MGLSENTAYPKNYHILRRENGWWWWWFRVFPKCSVKTKKKHAMIDPALPTIHYIHYIHCQLASDYHHPALPVTRSSSIFFQACQMAPVSHGSRCHFFAPKLWSFVCMFFVVYYHILLYHAISQYRFKKKRIYIYNTIIYYQNNMFIHGYCIYIITVYNHPQPSLTIINHH